MNAKDPAAVLTTAIWGMPLHGGDAAEMGKSLAAELDKLGYVLVPKIENEEIVAQIEPHLHKWKAVGVDHDTVYFGCSCGDAIRTRPGTHPIEQLRDYLQRLLFEAKAEVWLRHPDEEVDAESVEAGKPQKHLPPINAGPARMPNGDPAMLVPVSRLNALRGLLEDRRR